jgi:hypothetical protein
MYFPYSRRRKPTNRECRIASILSIAGFIAAGWAVQYPPLDERETLVRYRTFLTSYQILSVLIWVIVMVPVLLGSHINVLTPRYHGPIELGLLALSLLMILTLLLPHWVLPWLESNVTFDAEADLEPAASPGDMSKRATTIAWNVIVWILVFLVILWIFSSYFPGGLRSMFH